MLKKISFLVSLDFSSCASIHAAEKIKVLIGRCPLPQHEEALRVYSVSQFPVYVFDKLLARFHPAVVSVLVFNVLGFLPQPLHVCCTNFSGLIEIHTCTQHVTGD